MEQGFIIIHGMVGSIIIITILMVFQFVIILIMVGVLVLAMALLIIGMAIPIGDMDIIIGDLHITDRLIITVGIMPDHHIQFILAEEA
jgi:hypothetical protein